MKKFVRIGVGHSFCGQMQSLRWALANASIGGYEPFKIDCDVAWHIRKKLIFLRYLY